MKVLFVCRGNIERSATAEIIGKILCPHWEIKSCGVAAKDGRITSKKMRQALSQRGWPAEGIRSTQISQELVDWADRIFYMDGGNERMFEAAYGKLTKAQRLTDFVDGANTVPNPAWCKDLTLHLKIVDLIVEALTNIHSQAEKDTGPAVRACEAVA